MRLEVRQVFPAASPARRREGSPLHAAPHHFCCGAGLPLRAHSNLLHASGSEQPRGFPQDIHRLLASLAATVSETPSPSLAATQGRLRCTQHQPQCRFTPGRSMCCTVAAPRAWVSTRGGRQPHAIANHPVSLNPQHRPPTGRRQPAPGTSQMCPWRIFSPAFGVGNIN